MVTLSTFGVQAPRTPSRPADRPVRVAGVLLPSFLTLLASVVLLLAVAPVGAQKVRPFEARLMAGPPAVLPAERVHTLRAHAARPVRVYGGTRLGLFVSGDRGRSWAALPVGGTHDEVFGLALHPTDPGVVVVGRRDGLWQTQDGGSAWSPLAAPVQGPHIPLAVALAESRPDVLYVATARHGLFRSPDGGRRWVPASQGLPEAVAGGRTAEFRALAVHPANPDVAYAAHARLGVYRTTDGGATWEPFSTGLPFPMRRLTYPPRFAFDPDQPTRLYLVCGEPIHSGLVENRVYVNTGTAEWHPVEAELPPNAPVVGVTADRGARVLRVWTETAVWEVPLGGK